MGKPVWAGVAAATVAAVGVLLSGCGSDAADKTSAPPAEQTSTSSSTAQAAPLPTAAPSSAPNYTIEDYIRDNGIQETAVRRGDPGIPQLTLPVPPAWQDLGGRAPQGTWGGLVFADPAVGDGPPTIIAKMSRLTGKVDPAKVIEFAKGELKNLPGYQGGDGKESTLSGFDAWQVAGLYTAGGTSRVIASKTVVIPHQDAVYVLYLNADGRQDQLKPLMDATNMIDQQATITP
jgi:hypothetical protein